MRWREMLTRFMTGRYGQDALSRAMSMVAFVLLIISMFVAQLILYPIAVILVLLSTFRMFSKNHQKRYQENLVYTKQINKVKYLFSKLRYRTDSSKTHHIYACPGCRQKIRVPRGKGKIMVRCPKCQTEFMKRS